MDVTVQSRIGVALVDFHSLQMSGDRAIPPVMR